MNPEETDMTEVIAPERTPAAARGADAGLETFDVLIVGAGISGVGGAYHLLTQRPGTRFLVLETQGDFGGTWRTHRYPGIRSDSDLYTFGYRFKPWTGAPIATAEKILQYMQEVIDENRIDRHIRYHHTVKTARWSTQTRLWTLDVERTDTGQTLQVATRFLWMCQGYYRHQKGYMPQWPGMSDFAGQIVHPQEWPQDLDLTGKRVVVVGSGATAATVVPAVADQVAHVTMLQRSPTYFITGRNANQLADTLRELDIKEEWIHEIVRRKILHDGAVFHRRCATEPEVVRKELLGGVRHFLGQDFDVEKHFSPRYAPWKQRIAFIPDGDLFQAVKKGKASVVTDEIETFTRDGLLLKSGDTLAADVIVAATGFNLNVLGDVDFRVDDQPLDFASTVTWNGTMFTGVPNMVWVFGYFRASWTLRADLIGDFVCRLLGHMQDKGASLVVPQLREQDMDMQFKPWVDPENFNPGYIMRGLHLLPRQGNRDPWRHGQDYPTEKETMPRVDLDDGSLIYR
jgi:cation diffusion facilitator CzcD-associated flavoprotein CzcO